MLHKNRILVCLLSIITVFSFLPLNVRAEGNRDISNQVVESIVTKNADGTSETDSVSIWSNFQVDVTFSEDDENGKQKTNIDIRSGDRINISWSSPEGVDFIGYSNTIDLKQDGITIAQAVITETGAAVTFNDNVNNLQHVKGTLNFTIQTRRTETYEEAKNGTVTAGEKTKTITVTPSSGSNPGKFGEKSAVYETDGTNTIRWGIVVNYNYQTNLTDTVTIVDVLPDTETLVEEGVFQIDLRSQTTGWSTKAETIAEVNALEGYSVWTNGKEIRISIPANDLNLNGGSRGYVTFYTTSTAAAGSRVSNSIDVTHFEHGTNTPINNTYEGGTTVPDSGGTIEGVPKGTIQINKVVNGTTDPIEGVHFYVYKVNSEADRTRVSGWYNGQDYVEIISDREGIASIENLEDGYYEIEETPDNLPNWIAVTSISENLFVTLGGTAGTKVDIENNVKTTDISATKNWIKENEEPDVEEHPIIYLQLYRSVENRTAEIVSDAELKQINTQTGESSATVTWNDLPQYDNTGKKYTYSVKEVNENGTDFVPTGYSKDESGLIVTNTKELTSVTVTKKWEDSDNQDGIRPSNVTVVLLADGEETGKTLVLNSGNKWTASFTALDKYADGKEISYTVKEVKVEGYTNVITGTQTTGYTITNSHTPKTPEKPSVPEKPNTPDKPRVPNTGIK